MQCPIEQALVQKYSGDNNYEVYQDHVLLHCDEDGKWHEYHGETEQDRLNLENFVDAVDVAREEPFKMKRTRLIDQVSRPWIRLLHE